MKHTDCIRAQYIIYRVDSVCEVIMYINNDLGQIGYNVFLKENYVNGALLCGSFPLCAARSVTCQNNQHMLSEIVLYNDSRPFSTTPATDGKLSAFIFADNR